jgi:DNA-binding NtrC family response regulator
MINLNILLGKRILAVDDEPDVLEVIQEALDGCQVVTARDYKTAADIVANENFHLVILDIMGVEGFKLLELAGSKRIPAAMLTAHAMTVESINKALKLGAVSFLPKEELDKLPQLVAEIFESLAQGQTHWKRLFERLGPFFSQRLGIGWDDLEEPKNPPYLY